MSSSREHLVEWLRDAHAAEEQAASMLKKTASQLEANGAFRAGLERHGERSAAQAAELKQLLEGMGESTSMIKTITGQITALGQSLSGYLVGDEPVKAALATATFAHMEIASYTILVAAAEAAGEANVARVCETMLGEEAEFARWLDQQIPLVVRHYLAAEAAG